MRKKTTQHQVESTYSSTKLLSKFAWIFTLVFISQIPGCIVVFSDDAGQIDNFKHEWLTKFANATFAFPLKLLINSTDGLGLLIFVYFGNILLLSSIAFIIFLAWDHLIKNLQNRH